MIANLNASMLPDWADPRLTVRLRTSGDSVFVIDHNPHTLPGMVGLYDVESGRSASARPIEITEAGEFARGWLEGFLHGSEPEPPRVVELEALRWERERQYFHTHQWPLPRQRRGQFAINAACNADGSRRVSTVYAALAQMVETLGKRHPFWRNTGWIPVVDETLPAIPLNTATAVEAAFAWISPPYTMTPQRDDWRPLTMFCDAAGGVDAGLVVIDLSYSNVGDSIDEFDCSVQFERPDAIADLPGRDDPQTVLREVFEVVVDSFDPDTASLSHGAALQDSEFFAIDQVDDDKDLSTPMVPGWLTYISDRLAPDLTAAAKLATTIEPMTNGRLIRIGRGLSEFDIGAANSLAAALSIPRHK